ncbi:MAG: hypothetical protein CV087_18155 [Candidatus Brocadia sp. WS118]|nr:MAG: hypothetical protein CV087_18155 [Candidatus Brocadia sp. WS118]
MVNNINHTTSKLLEQIQRLATHTTKKEENHIDFKDDIINYQTDNARELKRTNLLNSIERTQKKIKLSTQPLDNIKNEVFLKSVQTSEWPKFVDMPKNNREKPLGSFLDIYL